MSTYELLAELPLVVEDYELEGHEVAMSSEFVRKTTVIRLRGAGMEGLGEDVTYAVDDQEALQREGAGRWPLGGQWTLASFAEHLRSLDLFPQPSDRAEFRLYRNWAFDSAALDLALRQAGTTLHAALGRECAPLSFVASLRLGEPPTLEPLRRRLQIAPGLQFKLDPTPSWDEQLIAGLVELGAVESVDLKGQYEGTIVDNPADPELYRRVVEAFAEAWIEDPKLTPETEPILLAHRDRITWDAPIHSVDDILNRPVMPRTVNLKPSRFGSLEALLAAYEFCEQRQMGAYGGGQYELGVGREHIQLLAGIFHPDAPNDIAPGGYDALDPEPGLPTSPLQPHPAPTGFRRSLD